MNSIYAELVASSCIIVQTLENLWKKALSYSRDKIFLFIFKWYVRPETKQRRSRSLSNYFPFLFFNEGFSREGTICIQPVSARCVFLLSAISDVVTYHFSFIWAV